MKLLHTSDWHLGRQTYNVSRAPDHDAAIVEIADIATHFHPNLIIHTGDLFDGPRPPLAEMERAIAALQELAAVSPVLVVAGNHDAPGLFRLFNRLGGQQSRIRFAFEPLPPAQGGILEFPVGEEVIRVAPVPFISATRFVKFFEDPSGWNRQYAERIASIMAVLKAGLENGYDPRKHVLLTASHLFVAGAHFSKSERPLTVTDQYATRVEHLPAVSYAAFGHIHRPQPLPGTQQPGAYAGSPIQLDYGEEGEQKRVVLVEASAGQPAVVTSQPLTTPRQLRKFEGSLEGLPAWADRGPKGALCHVTIKSEVDIPGLAGQVRDILSDYAVVWVAEDSKARRIEAAHLAPTTEQAEASFSELFRLFLSRSRTSPGVVATEVASLFDDLLMAAEQDETPTFTVLDRLRAVLGPELGDPSAAAEVPT